MSWFLHMFRPTHEMGVVQPVKARHLPVAILRRAHDEYQRQGHRQSFERIQERGGFSLVEVIALLADALEVSDGGEDRP